MARCKAIPGCGGELEGPKHLDRLFRAKPGAGRRGCSGSTSCEGGPKLRGLKCLNPCRQIRTNGVRRPIRNQGMNSANTTMGVMRGQSRRGGETQQGGIRILGMFRRKGVLIQCNSGGIETVRLPPLNTQPRGGGAEGGVEGWDLLVNARGMAISLGQIMLRQGSGSRARHPRHKLEPNHHRQGGRSWLAAAREAWGRGCSQTPAYPSSFAFWG